MSSKQIFVFANFGILLLFLSLSIGCAAGPYARHGAVGGGLAGGAIGALAGAPSDRSLEGAAIGAVAGSVIGNLTGNMADQDRYAYQNQQAAYLQQARAQALNIPQVIQLSNSGVGDQLIINQMRSSGVLAPLTANDIVVLKQNGVSDTVIGAWQSQPAVGTPAARAARVRPVVIRTIPMPAYGHDYYDPYFDGPRHCGDGWH